MFTSSKYKIKSLNKRVLLVTIVPKYLQNKIIKLDSL